MSWKFVLVFATTVFVASIIPGPSMILALNHGLRYGARRTLATAGGNLTATLLQALLSIAGLGAVMVRSEVLFDLIRYAGALYLVYLGLRILRAPGGPVLEVGKGTIGDPGPGRLFGEAFVVTIGNPKAIIFFTALFPQFLTSHSTMPQFAVILLILAIIAFGCMMIYGVFGQRLLILLNRAETVKMFNRLTGLTFIGLGIGLVLDRGRM